MEEASNLSSDRILNDDEMCVCVCKARYVKSRLTGQVTFAILVTGILQFGRNSKIILRMQK